MKLTDDLENLSRLHKEGSLTAAEFSKAKEKLLAEESSSNSSSKKDWQEPDKLGDAANRYVTFQIVASIIGGIIFLIIFLNVIRPHSIGTPVQVIGVTPR